MSIILALPALFIFLSASLIWFLIGSTGAWWIKLTMVIITPLLAAWAWVSVDNALGYPKEITASQLNGKTATLFFQVVDEPKSIFLWVKIDGDEQMKLYQLPYSRSMHKSVDESGAGSKGAVRVKFGSPVHGAARSGSTGEPAFYVLPPPILSPKTR